MGKTSDRRELKTSNDNARSCYNILVIVCTIINAKGLESCYREELHRSGRATKDDLSDDCCKGCYSIVHGGARGRGGSTQSTLLQPSMRIQILLATSKHGHPLERKWVIKTGNHGSTPVYDVDVVG